MYHISQQLGHELSALETKAMNSISDIYAWPLPEATLTTIVIKFVLPVGNLGLGASCHVYFSFSQFNSR